VVSGRREADSLPSRKQLRKGEGGTKSALEDSDLCYDRLSHLTALSATDLNQTFASNMNQDIFSTRQRQLLQHCKVTEEDDKQEEEANRATGLASSSRSSATESNRFRFSFMKRLRARRRERKGLRTLLPPTSRSTRCGGASEGDTTSARNTSLYEANTSLFGSSG